MSNVALPRTTSSPGAPVTVAYKHHADGRTPMKLDVYLPTSDPHIVHSQVTRLPVLLYFHGGGLTVGNRTSWFPEWMKDRSIAAGLAFISADYNLVPPATGHDIIADIQDLFAFLQHGLNDALSSAAQSELSRHWEVDAAAVGVAGSSSGGLCAYLAAIHAVPKPKALLSLYGQGGDLLTSHYLFIKSQPFYRGREILHPTQFTQYLFPQSLQLAPISDSELAYCGSDAPIPGYPANPRMLLARLYLQLGIFLDYYTGAHDPGLSLILRQILEDTELSDSAKASRMVSAIGPEHRTLFPHLALISKFPASFLVHGEEDTAVSVHESQCMHALLRGGSVEAELRLIKGNYLCGEACSREDSMSIVVLHVWIRLLPIHRSEGKNESRAGGTRCFVIEHLSSLMIIPKTLSDV